MLRRIAIVVGAIVLAVIVNLAIATLVWVPVKWAPMHTVFTDTTLPWPEPVPERWRAPNRFMTKVAFGLRVRLWTAHEMTAPPPSQGVPESTGPAFRSEHFDLCQHESGWPLRCLRRTQWDHFALERTLRSAASTTIRFNDLPARSWWLWGAPFPAFLDRVEPGWKAVPIRPIWGPLAINIILWSALFLLPVFLTSRLRTRRRRRAGRCLACGYSLAGLDPAAACPECGHAKGEPDS